MAPVTTSAKGMIIGREANLVRHRYAVYVYIRMEQIEGISSDLEIRPRSAVVDRKDIRIIKARGGGTQLKALAIISSPRVSSEVLHTCIYIYYTSLPSDILGK